MLWHRMRGLNRAYYCALVVVVSGLFWLYLFLLETLIRPPGGYTYKRYVVYNLAAICALALRALNSGTKSQELLRSDFSSNHRAALRDMSVAGAGILLILVATKDPLMSRLFLFTFLPLLYFILFICHRFLPTILNRTFFTNGHMQKALLVGPIEKAERIETWSNQMLNLGLDASCFLHGLGGNGELSHSLYATGLMTLERIVRRERITQVVLLEMPGRRESLSEIVAVCNRLGSRLLLIDNLPEMFNRRVSHFSLSGLDLVTVMEEPLEDPVNRLLKRTVDLLMSALVVGLVLPPLTVLVAIAQRRQSPGPLFYTQTRSGRGNKPFRIIKFRTMLPTNKSPSRQVTRNDGRVYPFGRFLRKTSLDEIPQFLNVLRGEMSVVGPRPHMIIHNRRFEEIMASYRIRAFVKPGITGIAQVNGHRGEARTDNEILERLKMDITYVENWSLWRDLVIILKTIRYVIVPHDAAY
jgi:exopolysaccharide biosynthesis polyprenyl glycosylphosphotransferase